MFSQISLLNALCGEIKPKKTKITVNHLAKNGAQQHISGGEGENVTKSRKVQKRGGDKCHKKWKKSKRGLARWGMVSTENRKVHNSKCRFFLNKGGGSEFSVFPKI